MYKYSDTHDLHPMKVTPFNFQRGDVVKKIITDKIQSPFVGVVSSVIPSTNKVEVQWPDGMGIEDPWDLIKVNPLINPPVVEQDKAYKTFQNQLSHDYFEKIQPFYVLKQYLDEKYVPILHKAAEFYNKGMSKESSFYELRKSFDNDRLIINSLEKVYANSLNYSFVKDFKIQGVTCHAEIKAQGNDESGYRVFVQIGDKSKELSFDNYKEALDSIMKFEKLISSIGSAKLDGEM